jgi:hypothetical protein
MSDLQPRINVGLVIAKGALGQLPIVGTIVNELLTEVIPNRRIERLQELFERLDERVARLEPVPSRDRFADPLFVDLLEDGMLQAARATSSLRLEHIAELLANGISLKDRAAAEHKFLLHLLGELNDLQVLRLIWEGKERTSPEQGQAFRERHSEALFVQPAYFNSSRDVVDRETLHEGLERHLLRLGLLERQYHRQRRDELPEFEETGELKGGWIQISGLGILLLWAIGEVK